MFRKVQTGNSLAVFSKIIIQLRWEDENKILDYIISWVLENMVQQAKNTRLFNKLTKVLKNIVDFSKAEGNEKVTITIFKNKK